MHTRKNYIDMAKGFAILMLLLSHVMSEVNILKIWIFCWHMPIFFIVCGVLTYMKNPNIELISVGTYLKNRLFQLGIPYLFFCVMLTIFYSALSLVSGSQVNTVEYLVKIISLQGIDSLWFIPCYFISEFIFKFFYLNLNKYIRFGTCLVFICVLCFIANVIPDNILIRSILRVASCIVFIYIGYLLQMFNIICKIRNIFICLAIFCVCALLSYFNGFVAIGSLQFGFVLLFYFNGVFTSLSILSFLRIIEQKYRLRWLVWFGKNSIVVLCTNNLLIESLRVVDHFLTGDILLRIGFVGELLFWIILIALEIPVIYISDSPLRVLFGKRKVKQSN